jgi:hydrogenase nickel incorporation protein HypA/HybF
MHELSIAMSLLDVAAEEAERRNVQVVAIHLRLGPLSGVVKEALLSAYELAREGSELADAKLVIVESPIVAWCPACQCEQRIETAQRICCPACNSPTPEIRQGRELEVIGLEVPDGVANAHGGSSPEGAQAE